MVKVDLHVELGKLHVSLVNATPAELLQLCVYGLCCDFRRDLANALQPVLELSLSARRAPPDGQPAARPSCVDYFQKLELKLAPLSLMVEESLVLELHRFVAPLLGLPALADPAEGEATSREGWEWRLPPSCGLDAGQLIAVALTLFGNIDAMPIRLKSHLSDWSDFTERLASHYVLVASPHVLVLLASLNITGGVPGLSGPRLLAALVGALAEPLRLGGALALGGSEELAALSASLERSKRAGRRRGEVPIGVVDGASEGVAMLLDGIVGLGGVISKPYRGALKHGPRGFAKGLVQGALCVLRPPIGVLDLLTTLEAEYGLTKTVEGLIHSPFLGAQHPIEYRDGMRLEQRVALSPRRVRVDQWFDGCLEPLELLFEVPLERMARVDLQEPFTHIILWTWTEVRVLRRAGLNAIPNMVLERHIKGSRPSQLRAAKEHLLLLANQEEVPAAVAEQMAPLRFFLMYTAVQPLAISGQLKASTLSPKPLDNTNNLFHSFLKQYRPGFRR
ncbi:hypothetical protein EMIHUDRAFT_218850 [Emiliania huxleyi CCMP1516]|uniref:Vacuolar protein sorting-associated protein 13 DH-like domain-containing protein n=2 Tax=Emiliania huxleyi TaxID=2903 RepID=A0A0D3I695_EMIH1|nr:hypothetical protein EMIHUDRAFT_218850 [Emiliania huxleyi CCMP1516]EOD06780.1 hypothetical protein EMIHUDRAFT_218850 [Emiliania huxleyi CCMP1516]|eukprot:XP_005759209.1 hypothetical protein EMIHUDRAFT_218850 [Emiliania huxleyi CCMP1516]